MAEYTENLGLLKKDPVADAKDTFNIQTMLNENWDKLDEAIGITAKIATGSYVGSGAHTEPKSDVTLMFDFPVKFLYVSAGNSDFVIFLPQAGVSTFPGSGSSWCMQTVTADGNAVTFPGWYNYGTSTIYPVNNRGTTYHYIALG